MPRLAFRSVVVLATAAILTGFAAAQASAAATPSPWWHLMLSGRPERVQPGTARDEVQKLTVSATGGEVILINPVTFETATVPFNASEEAMQTALEAIYGKGTVKVTGGPGDELGDHPYELTFVGSLAGESLPDLDVYGGLLSGGKAEATVSQVTAGSPDGQILVTATNLGNADADGEAEHVSLTDTLPKGLRATSVEAFTEPQKIGIEQKVPLACTLASAHAVSCEYAEVLPPYRQIYMLVGVVAEAGAVSGELDRAAISGGGAIAASASRPVPLGAGEPPFGIEDYEMAGEEEGGAADVRAGSHPFQLTTALMFNQGAKPLEPPALARNLAFRLPPGLIGNPTAFSQCSETQFLTIFNGVNECEGKAAMGVATVTIDEGYNLGLTTETVPVFNLKPLTGEPARFGFEVLGVPVFLDVGVRTGEDYGVTVTVSNTPETITFLGSTVSFWGVPGAASHDRQRGWSCVSDGRFHLIEPHIVGECQAFGDEHPQPFLSMPVACNEPQETTMEADAWNRPPGEEAKLTSSMPELSGCNQLPFAPATELVPDGEAASTPSGLRVKIHVPQTAALNPEGLSEGEVRDTTVALPEGVVLNPSAAGGLMACAEGQIALHVDGPSSCPEASKVASVRIKTPLLPQELHGFAYLAAQEANPFGSLIAMYVVAEDHVSGTLIKIAGEVQLSASGQITGVFKNTPQLPFEEFELHFFGGDRAPLATPARCGTYTTTAAITPWSAAAPVLSTSTFPIVSGLGGGPCPGSTLPFKPTLSSHTTNIQAGAFTPFTTTLSREDGNQDLAGVQLRMPPGLSGILTGVTLCPEAQANAGTCGPESLIGHTIVSVGLGGDPYSVTGGEVFLTEKYAGAPFGLSIVNPAVAGPFNLGKVVVRAKIEVNPTTAALTVTTGEIPHILRGIPLQIKHVAVTIEGAGGDLNRFMFNPTDCNPLAISGTLSSDEGASAALSVPFQVTNCAALKFAPKFQVSTSAHTNKSDGSSLSVKLSYPAGSEGTQANIAKVKVDLPIQLPSQLKTLQKACLAATFEANPANCPPQSIVGHAIVHTPLLPVPLSGPAYFVSHGGEAFPSLTMVLQGYGVTIDLVGSTFIKNGVTSTTFRTVPDVPFNTFELNLPKGKYAALAADLPAKAKNSFCGQNLKMPTLFIAQNGLEIHEQTQIAVTGCPKAAKKARKAKKSGKTTSGRHGKRK